MCYQKRLAYGACNHSAPLGLASTCTDTSRCEGARVHPLKTIRVEQMCPSCKEKKARVDNSLTTIAEKIRRLRGELARRGFGKEVAAGEPESGVGAAGGEGKKGSGTASGKGGSAVDGMPEDVDRLTADGGKAVVYLEAGGLCSPPPTQIPATDTSVKRNDMFVGGVCLASTSLMSISGKRLL